MKKDFEKTKNLLDKVRNHIVEISLHKTEEFSPNYILLFAHITQNISLFVKPAVVEKMMDTLYEDIHEDLTALLKSKNVADLIDITSKRETKVTKNSQKAMAWVDSQSY